MSVVVNLEENLGFTKVPSSTMDEFRWSRGTHDQSSWTILHQNLEKYKVEQFFLSVQVDGNPVYCNFVGNLIP